MNVVFLNSALAAAAALLAAPLLAHLLARSNPPTYQFSSNMFLARILKATKRVRKPQDILLLIIRTAIFAAIILMFLKPLLFSDAKLAAPWKKKNVVILVDASASMAGVDGGQTRFASALATASEILMRLGARDKANIVFIKAKPDPVFPSLASNIRFLAERLRKASVSNEPGNSDDAIEAALGMLDCDNNAAKEICVISDFQKTQWENTVEIKGREDVAMTFVKVGGEQCDNVALSKARSAPPRPLAGEKVKFECQVSNYSPSPKRVVVYFKLGPIRVNQTLLVPAWGAATPTFHVEGGMLEKTAAPYEFSIDSDGFPEDNQRWGVVRVSDNLKIGIAGSLEYPARIWRRALKTLSWVETASVALDSLSAADKLDFLFISGWDGSNAERVAKAVKAGTVVVCSFKPGVSCEALATLEPNAFSGKRSAKLSKESAPTTPFATRLAAPDDRIFALFADGRYGDPADALFLERLSPMKGLFKGAKNLVEFSDGETALARCVFPSGGVFYLWNLSLNPDKSDFAKRVQFVPFMAELLLRERKISADGLAHLIEHAPGGRLLEALESADANDAVRLLAPDGETVPTKISVAGNSNGAALSIVSDPVYKLGVYEWRFAEKTIDRVAVDFPSSESDLRTLSTAELADKGASAVAKPGGVAEAREGLSMWPYMLALAFILALCECGVALWAEKPQSKEATP